VPQFTLPNISAGGSITVNAADLASAQQAAASQTGVSLGQQQAGGTFGSNTFGGGGGTTATAPGAGAAVPTGLDPTGSLAGLQAFAAQTSGVTQAQLAQQKAEFDAQLNFAKDQMTQLGIPQLQINQFLAQMQQQQFQSQLALAQQAQQFNQASTTAAQTGWYTPPPSVPDVSGYTGQQGWTPGQQFQAGAPPVMGTAPSGAAGGGGQASGTGYFIGTDGRIHVGSPQGTGQKGWGSAQGNMAASGWAPGTQSSDPNVFLQPPSAGAPTTGGTAGVSLQSVGQPGYFIGTDGRIHVGSPTGTGQAGWGSSQGLQAAAGWAPGTTSSNPNVFTVPQNQVPQTPTTPTGGATGTPPAQPGQPTPGSQMTMQLGQLLGQYNGAPTEQATEFARNLALQQGQLGQQYLATAAQLQGPQNTFQLSNYLRGAQGNQSVPVYLQNLASNVGNPMFQAPGSTAPTTQTAAGLAGQMGGQTSATPGWDYNQTLGAIQNIMGQGAQRLSPGALESLSPDELQAFGSGLGAVGGSLPAFLQQYNASRVGQTAPVAQTSLA
jgi:hypothetical protein